MASTPIQRALSNISETYFGRWSTQVVRQILSLGRDQIVGLVLAVLILLYQLKSGLIQTSRLMKNRRLH
jgi:hypothetical protein